MTATLSKRWSAFAVCLLAGFMTLLDVSIVNVALPSMQAGLHMSSTELSWVIAGYTLTFGLALVPSGRLGDSLGRRRMFLFGLAFFTAVSLACGLALTGIWLVCGRLVQGIAGGLLTPQVVGMMQQLFSGSERGKASGLYAAMIATATAIGPLAGGLLIQAAGTANGWRWVFFVNVPIGVLAIVLGARLLPRDHARWHVPRIDLVGLALLGSGIAAIILPLADSGHGGAGNWYLVAVGAILMTGFVAWEWRCGHRGGQPLVNLALLRQRSYAFGALIGVPYFAGYSGVPFVVSLYFQQGLGYSALIAGAAGIPFAAGSAISAVLAGRSTFRFGRRLVVLGAAAVSIGLTAVAVLIHYTYGAPMWLVLLGPLFVAGAGSGAAIGPNLTLALQQVPPAEGGTAAAVLQTGQRIGSAVGLAIAGSLFFGTLIATHGNFSLAASRGLLGCVAFVVLALLVASVDLFTTRAHQTSMATDSGVTPVERVVS